MADVAVPKVEEKIVKEEKIVAESQASPDRDRERRDGGEVLIHKEERRQRSPERSDRRRSPERDSYRRRSPERDSYRRRSPERERPRGSYDRHPSQSSSRYDRNASSSRYRERSRSREKRDDRRRRSRSRSEDRRESRPASGSSVVDLLHKVLSGGLPLAGLAALQVRLGSTFTTFVCGICCYDTPNSSAFAFAGSCSTSGATPCCPADD